jgi:hypothetical protein
LEPSIHSRGSQSKNSHNRQKRSIIERPGEAEPAMCAAAETAFSMPEVLRQVGFIGKLRAEN